MATQLGWLTLHFTLVAGVLFALTLALGWAWQWRLGGAPDARALASVARRGRDALPRAQRVGAIVLVLATMALVYALR